MQKLLQISAGVFLWIAASGLRVKTENKGFAGSRAQTLPEPQGEIWENPAPGLRKKTKNKGFAGSRAQTLPAPQGEIWKKPAPGLRMKTKNKGFAGSRAQTVAALQREKGKLRLRVCASKRRTKGLRGAERKPRRQEKSRRLLLVSGGSGDGIYASFNFGYPGKLWPGRMFFLWGIKR